MMKRVVLASSCTQDARAGGNGVYLICVFVGFMLVWCIVCLLVCLWGCLLVCVFGCAYVVWLWVCWVGWLFTCSSVCLCVVVVCLRRV